ncbi:MAG: type III-A CRISPR-associated protein Cas10/Csm1 [Chloroflexota bacterium]|nr:type III-A CRISPR-associated protein Cas10/Csm1 [Chloroflexota bacterium]
MRNEIFITALAGLLHDIGKFALRAGMSSSEIWDEEGREIYGYKHALLSADFCRDYVPSPWREIVRHVSFHHRPHDRLDRLVAVGDRLSAGEREPSEAAEPQRLLSIFNRISLAKEVHDNDNEDTELYLPLKPLRLAGGAIFPQPLNKLREPGEAYEDLWAGFTEEARRLREAHEGEAGDGITYLRNLLSLMRRFTWCIPAAAYRAVPDVSLYDHSRMTAALAVCLRESSDEELETLVHNPFQEKREVASLVGGDISGVQDFIYTITSQGAASALRGRSLYLQLLTDAIVHYLLRHLGLPPTNLVYAGGGQFYLLTPPGVEEALAEAQRYASRVLLRHHGGDLYVALGTVTLQDADFAGGRIASRWAEVTKKLRVAKGRRFRELGADMHRLMFDIRRDKGSEEDVCQVCHREHPQCVQDDGTRKCPACLSYERDLGAPLRRANYLLVEEVEPAFRGDEGPAGDCQTVLRAFGQRTELLESLDGGERAAPNPHAVWALNDDAMENLQPGPHRVVGRRFLVNVTPVKQDGRIRTTDEMAEASRGTERLGVLRMDVDDMGRVFAEGLGEWATISRVATLSLAISLYFEGWVEEVARAHDTKGNRIYSIYSGGDDLSFVGSWDAVVEVAKAISDDFARYTGYNPDLHLSGGMTLVGGKYPIYTAAAEAGACEKRAKDFPGKNAFNFLGQTVSWERFAEVARWQEKLAQMVEETPVRRSLLRLLIGMQEQHAAVARKRAQQGEDRTQEGKPQAYFGPWIPRAEYMLARMKGRVKDHSPSAAADLEALRKRLREENYRSLTWIGLAARWAELLIRNGRSEEGDA